MTTNCFDVVSLFDLEKTKQATTTNAKTNRLKGPVVGVSMNVVVCDKWKMVLLRAKP